LRSDERLEYDLLFRWFVGLGVDDASWDQTYGLAEEVAGWHDRSAVETEH
jgi:hypothetical protein